MLPTIITKLIVCIRLEDAISCYDKSIELKPNEPKAYNNIGNILYKLGKFRESIIALEKGVSLHPYYALANHNRNIFICKLGKQYRASVA